MARPALGIALIALIVVAASPVVSGDASQEDARAEILVGDLVIGESEQRLGQMRAFGFDDDVDELVITIDLSVLETHGVDVSDATIDLTDDHVQGATVESATVEDGIVTLVLAPGDSASSNYALIVIDAFRLSGLDTTGAEGGSDLTFDASFSEGEAAVHGGFDIIDPDEVTPTVAPTPLITGADRQRITITNIPPADGPVTIEINTTVLESHGVGVNNLEADADTDGAMVRETTVENGVVTVVLGPANDTRLFDAEIELRGFNTTGVDADDRVAVSNVTYDVRLAGAATDQVDVKEFDIITEGPQPETRHRTEPTPTTRITTTSDEIATTGAAVSPADGPTPVSEETHGFGIAITLIALIGIGLAVARYR